MRPATQATLIFSADVVGSEGSLARVWSAGAIAHELGHVIYGSARDRYVGRADSCSLPWEIAEVVAFLAAEEYRVDRIGHTLVDRVLNLATDGTLTVGFKVLVEGGYIRALPAALDAVLPGIVDIVHSYRCHETSLDEMWAHVVTVTEQMLLLLAHAQAHDCGQESVLDCVRDHPAAVLLRPVWDPLLDYLARTPVIPDPTEWPGDREGLRALGREPLLQFWAYFGLQSEPRAEGFYLHVGEPAV